jgi:signal transduction histidine kinase
VTSHAAADRRLLLAAALAVAAVSASTTLHVTAVPGAWPPAPAELVPLLMQLGFLCGAGLAARPVRPVAWLLLVAAVTVGASQAIGVAVVLRELDPGPGGWALTALLVSTSAAAACLIAALYAVRPERSRPSSGIWLAIGAISWLLASGLVAGGALLAGDGTKPDIPGLPVITWPTSVWRHILLAFVALGVAQDLAPIVTRTRRRLIEGDTRPSKGSALTVFLDELVPGRAEARLEGATAERERLAADLHAQVLPTISRALAEAEAGGSPELLARRLHETLAELEDLMIERRFVVLEAFGLVEALEWLAERSQELDSVRIDLHVEEPPSVGDRTDPAATERPEGAGRAPIEVERAAFVVARLAVDNALRHGGSSRVRIDIVAGPTTLRLAVTDDGRGIPVGAEDRALRTGRVGLADMRRETERIGGRLSIRRDGDAGTIVELRWAGA